MYISHESFDSCDIPIKCWFRSPHWIRKCPIKQVALLLMGLRASSSVLWGVSYGSSADQSREKSSGVQNNWLIIADSYRLLQTVTECYRMLQMFIAPKKNGITFFVHSFWILLMYPLSGSPKPSENVSSRFLRHSAPTPTSQNRWIFFLVLMHWKITTPIGPISAIWFYGWWYPLVN